VQDAAQPIENSANRAAATKQAWFRNQLGNW